MIIHIIDIITTYLLPHTLFFLFLDRIDVSVHHHCIMEVIICLHLAFTLEHELQYNAEDLVCSDIPRIREALLKLIFEH